MRRLAFALARLSGRERTLLGLLVAAVLPLGLVFLAIMPMLEARRDAAAALREAEALREWVAARVAELPPETRADIAETPVAVPVGLSALEQGLSRAGLRDSVRQLSNTDGGGAEIEFGTVPFDRLTAWLHEASADWGYRVGGFRIVRDAPGLVSAGFRLDPAR